MKKGFPMTILGMPIGWRKRGKTERKNDGKIITELVCGKCFSRLHIGTENGETFVYCPKCLAKISEIEDYQFGEFKGMYYRWGGTTGEEMLKRIEAFESYLGIHYEEKTTKGYVKNKKK